MLKLSLVAKQGNGVRYFPHAGYLRLTPLKIEGIVRTRIDEDNKPLLCSGLYVALRCYESRLGLGLGLGSTSGGAENGAVIGSGIPSPSSSQNTNVLFEIVVPLWTPPSASVYEPLGEGQWPFKIVVPSNASPVCSTVHFQEYRVFWRVEAVLTHMPITGVGMRLVKMQEVPLMRYDARQDLPPQPPNKWRRVSLSSRSSKTPPSTLKYIINNPPFPFAPLDHVPVTLKLSLPPGVDVTSVALSLERRLAFRSSDSSIHNARGNDPIVDMEPTPTHLPLSPQSSSKGATAVVIASTAVPVTSLDRSRQTGHGSCTITTTLQIPQIKSLSHWSVGETMHTPLASVRFFLKCKLTIIDSPPAEQTISHTSFSSPSPSQPPISSAPLNFQNTSHSYTIDLQEKELYVIATNEADRREAVSKYRDAVGRGRKRRINASGKEKEKKTTGAVVTELESATPMFSKSEPDSPARSRSSSKPMSRSRSKSRFRKARESSEGTPQTCYHQKENTQEVLTPLSPLSPSLSPLPSLSHQLPPEKTTGLSSGEGKTNGGEIYGQLKSSTTKYNRKYDARSKEKKADTISRTQRLTLFFLTPRSRRFFRQGLASDGDANVDIDNEGRVYDGEYVLVDNESPVSPPPGWRMPRHHLLVPPSSYPPSPTSPGETSADESSSRRVVYLFSKEGGRDQSTSTNVSTNITTTTTTTTSEGTEEIYGPPTPPDDASLLAPQIAQTHCSNGEPPSLASVPSCAVATCASSSQPTILIPTPILTQLTQTPTTLSTPFSRNDQGMEEKFGSHAEEDWEAELKKAIVDGAETEMASNIASEKRAKNNASTIAGIRFRKKKSRKIDANFTNDAQACCESDTYPASPSCLSPPSPIYIPFSPSTPALPIIHTAGPTSFDPTGPSIPKPKSKAKGFGINWGFGWGQNSATA